MKMYKLFFAALIFISITQTACREKDPCDDQIKPLQKLQDPIKAWLPYSMDVNIAFENATGQTDTTRLKDFFDGVGNLTLGGECPSDKGELRLGSFINKLTNDTIVVYMSPSNVFQTSRRQMVLNYNEGSSTVENASSFRKFDATLTLNGKVFTNCISVECTIADACNSAGITKYYFAKTKGLVAYIKNNVLWTLK
jgi:hypothetical protein